MTRILLLGAGGSAGINYLKALQLAKEKIYKVGVDRNKYYLEMAPVNKKYMVSYEKGKELEYVDKIVKIVKRENIEFVHAQPDGEVRILSENREKIPAHTFLPSKEAIRICQDKWRTYEVLKKAKIPVPHTFGIANRSALKKIFKNNKEILWIRVREGAAGKGSLPVKEYNHALMWADYWIKKSKVNWSDFIISEFLPGKEVSWLSLWKDGKLICSQQKERIEWLQSNVSVSGAGTTTAIQKTVNYNEINEICMNTILAIDKKPNGIFVVDVKDNKKGIPCVTEINAGRFFTTSLFFATAGVNMPYFSVCLGIGKTVPKVREVNSVGEDIYWVRIADGGPVIVKNDNWSYQII